MRDRTKDTLTLWVAALLLTFALSINGCCSSQILERTLDDGAFSKALCKERAYIIHSGVSPNGFAYTTDQAAEVVFAIDKRMVANSFECDSTYPKVNGKVKVGLELDEVKARLKELRP